MRAWLVVILLIVSACDSVHQQDYVYTEKTFLSDQKFSEAVSAPTAAKVSNNFLLFMR